MLKDQEQESKHKVTPSSQVPESQIQEYHTKKEPEHMLKEVSRHNTAQDKEPTVRTRSGRIGRKPDML